MTSDSEAKDDSAGTEKAQTSSLLSRIVKLLKANAMDWGVLTALGTGAVFIVFLRWDVDEVKEDVESMRERVIRTEAMTEGIRGDIRDVHRDAAYIAGRLGKPDVSRIRPDAMP